MFTLVILLLCIGDYREDPCYSNILIKIICQYYFK